MPKDIPEKLREDLAACRFRQKRVPYPSGSLRPSLSRGSGNANGLEEQRLGAERKLLEDILGRQPTATLASRLDDSCRGLSALQGGTQAATGRSGSGSAEAENAMPPPDIVSTMARRLSTVEAANRQLRTESTSQNKELLALKRENESLRLAVAEADDRLREQEHEKESARSLRTVLDEVAELQSENDVLKAQVDDMKKFLSDYGLVWVGDRGGSARQDRAESKSDVEGGTVRAGVGDSETDGDHGHGRRLGGDVAEDKARAHASDEERCTVRHGVGDKSVDGDEGASVTSSVGTVQDTEEPGQIGFKVDFDILFEKFERLNALAGDSIAKVVRSGRRAQLKCPDGIPLVVYRDGIFLRRGPFRSFSGRHTQGFINDVMDGYYPSEFKDTYPDGVVFRLTDRRSTLYAERVGNAGNFSAFGGVGNKLSNGDDQDHACDGPSAGPAAPKTADNVGSANLRDALDEAKHCVAGGTSAKAQVVSSSLSGLGPEELPIGRDRFLGALPSSVVGKNGDVMPVRGAIAELLGSEHTVGEGNVAFDCARLDMDEIASAGDGTVTTLRVRSDDGTQALMLRMPDSATIADLRCLIDSRRGSSVTYELRTAFPSRVYTDEGQTLRDAGLSPNAQLMLRVTKGLE